VLKAWVDGHGRRPGTSFSLEPTHRLHSQVIVTWSSSHIDVVQFGSKFACCHKGQNQRAYTKKLWGWGVWRDAYAPSQYRGLKTLPHKI